MKLYSVLAALLLTWGIRTVDAEVPPILISTPGGEIKLSDIEVHPARANGRLSPRLHVRFVSPNSWEQVEIRFDGGVNCDGVPHKWSFVEVFRTGAYSDPPFREEFEASLNTLSAELAACKSLTVSSLSAPVLRAESPDWNHGVDGWMDKRIERKRRERETELARAEAIQKNYVQQRACHRLYTATATKRVSDLTVLQTKQVQACTVMGYYEPK